MYNEDVITEDEMSAVLGFPAHKLPEYLNSRMLSAKEAATFLGFSVGTLAVWRCKETYDLQFFKIGRIVKYRLVDLIAFSEKNPQLRRRTGNPAA